ncbi:hypothetical protein D3C87_989760 [compost metagenome]
MLRLEDPLTTGLTEPGSLTKSSKVGLKLRVKSSRPAILILINPKYLVELWLVLLYLARVC